MFNWSVPETREKVAIFVNVFVTVGPVSRIVHIINLVPTHGKIRTFCFLWGSSCEYRHSLGLIPEKHIQAHIHT